MRPVIFIIIALLLGGCGQIGPLYLPTGDNETMAEPAPTTEDAEESANDTADGQL